MAEINKKLLEHLADLSRLELTEDEETKFLGDLEKILNHCRDIKEVNTDGILPMTGGTRLKNIFRIDTDQDLAAEIIERENVKRAFPETEGDFLKVPPVFK